MLGMLVGHAGDVENDAGDVDGKLLSRTNNENIKKYINKSQNKSAPKDNSRKPSFGGLL